MKKAICFLSLLLVIGRSQGQQEMTDSTRVLAEVTLRAFEQNRSPQSSTAIVSLIRSNEDRNNKTSLVNSFNTIAGVRMEERSPGSYRINIRGSSLRSPFGVRNVKVYWNEIPFTDAGGNTYFNQFAWNNFSTIEIFKGPAGSLYGAGTGGLILMNSFDRWQPGASVELMGGSYDLRNLFASVRFGQNDHRNQLTYAHNESDGYRQQTAMRRDNFSWVSRLNVSDRHQLTAALLVTDMYYQTPGALNLAEYTADPKQARPAGGGFPSAVNAKAAIWQKNILAGFSNEFKITEDIHNTTTLYGSFTQIKNAAIRNYERRSEPQFGGRSIFNWKMKSNSTMWQFIAGGEFQQGYFNTQVSDNQNGNPDTLRTNDDINNSIYNLFAQVDADIAEKWFVTAGVSLNKSNVSIKRLNKYPVVKQSRSYENEFAPRLALLRKITSNFSVLASASKGFSPPTTAEVLPSTGVISTFLEAEHGWNYEMTLRHFFLKKSLQIEITGFYFKLNDALVQRRDLSGADYFVNAGDVQQKGIELHADYTYAPTNKKVIDFVMLQGAYSYNHFRYGDFKKGVDDFSGKTVPSVPENSFSFLADIQFKMGVYSNATYYYASKIFLNDANTATADAYNLLGWKLGWKKTLQQKYRLNIYAGVDNLLDEKYSLGNDINAAANRFYNAAPTRNYYAGIAFQWLNKKGN
jgi:iron complex outermembrane receptor protein